MNCNKCGAPLTEGALFCGECGAKVEATATVETTTEAPSQGSFTAAPASEPAPQPQTTYTAPSQPQANTTYTAPQSGPASNVVANGTPMIIWAIVNMVLCCLPLGIVALINAIKIDKAMTQIEADELTKKAKMWNIIATASAAVGVVIYIILMVIGAASGY